MHAERSLPPLLRIRGKKEEKQNFLNNCDSFLCNLTVLREYTKWVMGLIEPAHLLLTLDTRHQRPQSRPSFVTGVKSFDIYCSSLFSAVFLDPYQLLFSHV